MKKVNLIIFALIFLYNNYVIAKTTQTIIRIPLLTANIQPQKIINKIEIKRINLSAFQATGVHTHPIPVVGYIVKGTIKFQIEGEKEKILKSGDAFFEPANVKIIHFDNLLNTETSFIANYLLSKDDKELIKILLP